MKIDIKKIIKWSSKKESNYTYHDEKIGEVKIIITEHFNDKDEPSGVTSVKILKDNYCIPDLVSEVYKIHFKERGKK